MGRPKTLLEDLSAHALACGAEAIEVENRDGREWVSVLQGTARHAVANFTSSGSEAMELRQNLSAVRKKALRTSIGGRVWILRVSAKEGFGEDVFRVSIDPMVGLDPSAAPSFTKRQGQYLAFIYSYSRIHRKAPAETDLQRYFETTPPTVHQMIKTLELNGFIARTPGQARSIRLLVLPEHLPPLE